MAKKKKAKKAVAKPRSKKRVSKPKAAKPVASVGDEPGVNDQTADC